MPTYGEGDIAALVDRWTRRDYIGRTILADALEAIARGLERGESLDVPGQLLLFAAVVRHNPPRDDLPKHLDPRLAAVQIAELAREKGGT